MKLVVINQATVFARHWGRWYRVQRSGEDWRPLEIGKRYVKEKTITEISKELNKKYPSGAPLPAILDEAAADAEVVKNTPKRKRNGKKQQRKVS